MNTIFWLAVVFSVFSVAIIFIDFMAYKNSDDLNKLFYKLEFWPYPLLLACIVIALTV